MSTPHTWLPDGGFTAQSNRPLEIGELHLGKVPASLRALLLHDGTLTAFFEAVRLRPVVVDVRGEEEILLDSEQARTLETITGTRAVWRRAVICDAPTREILVEAESLIMLDRLPWAFGARLASAKKGVGAALLDLKLEYRRELLWFGVARDGAAVRCYRLVHNGKPAVCIRETFPILTGGRAAHD